MINRRSFFKAIGGAILGTAIALKIPETLIPQQFSFDEYIKGQIIAELELSIKLFDIRMQHMIYGMNC